MKNIIINYKRKNLTSLWRLENSRKGFTLVELLIFMGILTILLTILTQVFTMILDAQLESQANSSVDQDGKYIINRLTYDLNNAQDINTPAAPGQQEGTLQLAIGGINYVYSLNNGNIQLSDGNTIENLNSFNTNVSGLNFLRLGNTGGKNSIKITFTLTSKTIKNSGQEQETFSTTLGLR